MINANVIFIYSFFFWFYSAGSTTWLDYLASGSGPDTNTNSNTPPNLSSTSEGAVLAEGHSTPPINKSNGNDGGDGGEGEGDGGGGGDNAVEAGDETVALQDPELVEESGEDATNEDSKKRKRDDS